MTALLELATIAPHFIPEVLQNPSIRNPIAVSLGAIGGALSRYYLSILLAQKLGAGFPYATVTVNLTGSFAMGFFTALVLERALILSPELRLLIAVGFLGSYTTFSTFELDTLNLLRDAGLNTAAFYWLGSSALGSLSLFLGVVTARLIN